MKGCSFSLFFLSCSKGAERKVCVRKASVKQGFDAEEEGGGASGSRHASGSTYDELARAMPMGSCNAADLSPFVLSQEAQGILTSLLLQVLSCPLSCPLSHVMDDMSHFFWGILLASNSVPVGLLKGKAILLDHRTLCVLSPKPYTVLYSTV